MQLTKIHHHLQTFPTWLTSDVARQHLPVLEIQVNWQTHFKLEAADLADRYDRAYHAETNRRHYRRRGYEPKDALLALLRFEPELTREVFRDLFEQTRALDGRLTRSLVLLNELWRRYQAAHPTTPLAGHFHDDDYRTLTTYLAGQFPEQYAPYSTDVLRAVCVALGARDIPAAADVPRQVKLLRTLGNFVVKDEAATKAYASFSEGLEVPEKSVLPAWLFMEMIAVNKDN